MLRRLTGALLAAAALLGPLQACAAKPAKPAATAKAPANAAVLAAGARVADWQLAHMDNFDYIPASQFRRDTEAPRDWIQAAFYIGLAAFADAQRDPKYADAILAHGEKEGWRFDKRPRHADA